MKSFFLEVNESIETHVAEGQNKTKQKQKQNKTKNIVYWSN